MKIKILTSFLCINACLSFTCFSLPVGLDTWKNLHQSKEKNMNENFDDDINEIKKNHNFNLSVYLGVNEYTSTLNNIDNEYIKDMNVVRGIPLSLALGYRIKDNFRVDFEGVIQAVECKYTFKDNLGIDIKSNIQAVGSKHITNDDSKNYKQKVVIQDTCELKVTLK